MKNNNIKCNTLKLIKSQEFDPPKEIPVNPVPPSEEPITAFKNSEDARLGIGSKNSANMTTGNYLSL